MPEPTDSRITLDAGDLMALITLLELTLELARTFQQVVVNRTEGDTGSSGGRSSQDRSRSPRRRQLLDLSMSDATAKALARRRNLQLVQSGEGGAGGGIATCSGVGGSGVASCSAVGGSGVATCSGVGASVGASCSGVGGSGQHATATAWDQTDTVCHYWESFADDPNRSCIGIGVATMRMRGRSSPRYRFVCQPCQNWLLSQGIAEQVMEVGG